MLIKQEKQKGDFLYSPLLPIYPMLAQQFVDDYHLEDGICLDIGTGNGFVGTELAKITNMSIYYVDKDVQALEFARRTAAEAKIDNQVFFIEADVCAGLPFADQFADFIVSRGSLWFWEDKIKGVAEVYRVLKVGGTALIGGGLGRYIPLSMRKRLMQDRIDMLAKQGIKRPSRKEMEQIAINAGIPSFRIVQDSIGQDTGGWIEIHKHV